MKDRFSVLRKINSIIYNVLMYISVTIVISIVIGILVYVFYRGVGYITWDLLSNEPSLLKNQDGILPNILNTLYIILITLCVVLPLGVGAAVYLTEYAKSKNAVKVIQLAAETLSGIPSIIYGLVGMLIFVQKFSLGTSLIAGALTMVIVTLPTIMRTTEESLNAVPKGYREGSVALGAGKWHMIRTVVLPSAIEGIATGCILSVGRIIGESAALLFTAGMANNLMNIFEAVQKGSSGSTLSVALYVYAKERGNFEIAFAIAVVLIVLILLISLVARYLVKKLKVREN